MKMKILLTVDKLSFSFKTLMFSTTNNIEFKKIIIFNPIIFINV